MATHSFLTNQNAPKEHRIRRPRMSGRRISGTSRRFPRHFLELRFSLGNERKRRQESELPDLAWKSQTPVSQTSATTRQKAPFREIVVQKRVLGEVTFPLDSPFCPLLCEPYARFTVPSAHTPSKDPNLPYKGHVYGKMHSEWSCRKPPGILRLDLVLAVGVFPPLLLQM